MKVENNIKENDAKLKKLRGKTSDPKIKASIDKKLKQGDKPFNK